MRDGARTRSAASAVTTVRDRGLARAACDRLAGRCTAAPARRCLLATCSCAPQLCRKFTCWLVLAPMLAARCWPALVLVHRERPHRDARDQTWPSSARSSCPASSTRSVLRVVMMLLASCTLRSWTSNRPSWLYSHENGLLEIFLTVCGTSEAGFSGQDARRQQMSCAAAALLWPSCTRFFATPRPRLNPHC